VIYLVERREGLETLWPKSIPTTSESTRRFVSRLLSDKPVTIKSEGVTDTKILMTCRSKESDEAATYFYAYKNRKSGVISFVFNQILGKSSLYQLRADFPKDVLKTQVVAVDAVNKTRLNVSFEMTESNLSNITFYYSESSKEEKVAETKSVSCDGF
jgi:hypothetical protein